MFIIPPFALKQKYEKKNIENYERSNKYILSAAGFFSSFLQRYRPFKPFFSFCHKLFYRLLKKSPRQDRNAMQLSIYRNKYFSSQCELCLLASDSGSQAVDVMEVV